LKDQALMRLPPMLTVMVAFTAFGVFLLSQANR
jgi:hypothetical protein